MVRPSIRINKSENPNLKYWNQSSKLYAKISVYIDEHEHIQLPFWPISGIIQCLFSHSNQIDTWSSGNLIILIMWKYKMWPWFIHIDKNVNESPNSEYDTESIVCSFLIDLLFIRSDGQHFVQFKNINQGPKKRIFRHFETYMKCIQYESVRIYGCLSCFVPLVRPVKEHWNFALEVQQQNQQQTLCIC